MNSLFLSLHKLKKTEEPIAAEYSGYSLLIGLTAIYLSIHPSVCPSGHPSIRPSRPPSTIYLLYPSSHLPFYPSIRPPIHRFFCSLRNRAAFHSGPRYTAERKTKSPPPECVSVPSSPSLSPVPLPSPALSPAFSPHLPDIPYHSCDSLFAKRVNRVKQRSFCHVYSVYCTCTVYFFSVYLGPFENSLSDFLSPFSSAQTLQRFISFPVVPPRYSSLPVTLRLCEDIKAISFPINVCCFPWVVFFVL